jgi:hypothetical protein
MKAPLVVCLNSINREKPQLANPDKLVQRQHGYHTICGKGEAEIAELTSRKFKF